MRDRDDDCPRLSQLHAAAAAGAYPRLVRATNRQRRRREIELRVKRIQIGLKIGVGGDDDDDV